MPFSRVLFHAVLAVLTLGAPLCFAEDVPSELQKRLDFIGAYNGKRAEKRMAAISILEACKEERSIETLYFVSWADPDPEIRSRAFSAMVKCDDTYGFVAYLAAESFKRENEMGAKVEKAVGLGSLKYKWSALNELTNFLRTLRWNSWNWGYGSNNRSSGYIGSGNPPPVPGYPEDVKTPDPGYEAWRNREPLRWRNENEMIGLITATINRLSGARLESRPRIDQEIVKWWDRKSDLWDEYDRKVRAKVLENSKEVHFTAFTDMHFEEIKPGKDTLRDLLGEPKTNTPPKDGKSVDEKKRQSVMDDD